MVMLAATFGWLCVETLPSEIFSPPGAQPPSGGCVLKLAHNSPLEWNVVQPPSGGCVLKLYGR